MNLSEAATQVDRALGARVIEDDFDRGWQKAIERVVEFLTVDLSSDGDADAEGATDAR